MNLFGSISNWWNGVTGQGSFSDHGALSSVQFRPHKTPMEITELLEHAPLMRIACEAMPEDISRAWRTHSQGAPAWLELEEEFEYRDTVEQALFYAEGYGGALVFPRFTETLVSAADLANPRGTLKSGLLGLTVFAPHEVRTAPNTEAQRQANGLPMYFALAQSPDIKIHHSWIKTLRGPRRLPRGTYGPGASAYSSLEHLFGQSRVDIIYDDFARMASAYAALSHVLVKGNIDILKVKGLAEALSRCNDTNEMAAKLSELVLQASSTVTGANSFQPMVIDSEESLDRKGGNHTGAADIVRELQTMFVAATRIPRTRLFGEQAKGLGNGGEADLTSYYDRCASFRERKATGLLNWMDKVVAPGKRTAWEYNPLWQMSTKDAIEVDSKQATIDKQYFDMKVPGIESAVRARLSGDPRYTFTDSVVPQDTPDAPTD